MKNPSVAASETPPCAARDIPGSNILSQFFFTPFPARAVTAGAGARQGGIKKKTLQTTSDYAEEKGRPQYKGEWTSKFVGFTPESWKIKQECVVGEGGGQLKKVKSQSEQRKICLSGDIFISAVSEGASGDASDLKMTLRMVWGKN